MRLQFHFLLFSQIFLDWCSDEQKEKYLTKLSTGEFLGAFSLSEPQSGSDSSNLKMNAVKNGDSYILNGTKNWVTNGISSDIVNNGLCIGCGLCQSVVGKHG